MDVDGPVAIVSLDRPSKHNAMGDQADDEFFGHLESLRGRRDVRVVVWRGEGPSFSSGRDLSDLGVRPEGVTDFELIERGHWRTRLLYEFPVPIICALKGWVIGGQFERALLCDLRVAGSSMRCKLPELEHGVITDSAGVAKLFELGGSGLALDLALTGRVVEADEALRLGLVSRVVPDDSLDEVVLEMAGLIASRDPAGVRLIRENVQALSVGAVVSTLRRELVAQSLMYKVRGGTS